MTPGYRDIATWLFCDGRTEEEEELGILVVVFGNLECPAQFRKICDTFSLTWLWHDMTLS